MTLLETYRSNAVEAPLMRRWLFSALVLSLTLHATFFLYAYRKRLEGFHRPSEAQLAPPITVQMKQVTIPPMEEAAAQTLPAEQAAVTPKPVAIPSEKPVLDEVRIAPQNRDLSKELTPEKPSIDPAGLDRLAAAEAGTRTAMDRDLTAVNAALLKESNRLPRQPLITVGQGRKIGAGEGDLNAAVPGMKGIEDILAQTGPLRAGQKAGMPGGALFEYDSYDLRDDAVGQLRSLGLLIERNPSASFSIEGHTDSFGSPDYNQRLSEMRALAVKMWLVENMRIAPERIQTRGFGNTKPLVPSDKSKEEQAPNRRVEIVVKTNRK